MRSKVDGLEIIKHSVEKLGWCVDGRIINLRRDKGRDGNCLFIPFSDAVPFDFIIRTVDKGDIAEDELVQRYGAQFSRYQDDGYVTGEKCVKICKATINSPSEVLTDITPFDEVILHLRPASNGSARSCLFTRNGKDVVFKDNDRLPYEHVVDYLLRQP